MSLSREELSRLPWHARAALALRDAVAKVIAEHKRLGMPLAVWRDGQVVRISPEEAEAEHAAANQSSGSSS